MFFHSSLEQTPLKQRFVSFSKTKTSHAQKAHVSVSFVKPSKFPPEAEAVASDNAQAVAIPANLGKTPKMDGENNEKPYKN